MAATNGFSSGEYWEARYRGGGASGAGSIGRLARFKAAVINRFIVENRIESVIDVGCGDASQLGLLELPPDYVGVDVSDAALARCGARFPGRRFVTPDKLRTVPPAELTLSLDVLYHLIEVDAVSASPHVRHRRFTDHVDATEPDWRLLAHLPNPYPFDPAHPDDTSFADFFIYGRRDMGCSIVVPAA
jgi:hypothetical protein